MQKKILHKIKELKTQYTPVGFFIIGIFGSYARNEETPQSDIDILYNIDKSFVEKFGGWGAISKIEEIKNELKKQLNLDVDLASFDNPSHTFQKKIKDELIYV